MKEIKIKIFADSESINISNENNGKKISISLTEKTITAEKLYDVFSYEIDTKYLTEKSESTELSEQDKRTYNEVSEIIDAIRDGLNALNIDEGKKTESEKNK